jgi:type IV pilus assembly protein PilV
MLKRMHGITIVEVMVTILIIGVGLLGLLGLQAKSLSGHKDSMDRKAAAELVAQMSERMRANHLGFMSNAYASTFAPGASSPTLPNCGVATACSVQDTAKLDLGLWYRSLRARLPESGAYIVTSGGPPASMATNGTSARVTVVWKETQESAYADTACNAVGITDRSFRCLAAEVFP